MAAPRQTPRPSPGVSECRSCHCHLWGRRHQLPNPSNNHHGNSGRSFGSFAYRWQCFLCWSGYRWIQHNAYSGPLPGGEPHRWSESNNSSNFGSTCPDRIGFVTRRSGGSTLGWWYSLYSRVIFDLVYISLTRRLGSCGITNSDLDFIVAISIDLATQHNIYCGKRISASYSMSHSVNCWSCRWPNSWSHRDWYMYGMQDVWSRLFTGSLSRPGRDGTNEVHLLRTCWSNRIYSVIWQFISWSSSVLPFDEPFRRLSVNNSSGYCVKCSRAPNTIVNRTT